VRRLGELDAFVIDHLDPVAPGVQEVKERPLDHRRTRRLRQRAHRRTVVHRHAEMAMSRRLADRALHHGDELVAEVNERRALALTAQGEAEDAAVERQRLLHVADFERDVVDTHQSGLGPRRVVRHLSLLPARLMSPGKA